MLTAGTTSERCFIVGRRTNGAQGPRVTKPALMLKGALPRRGRSGILRRPASIAGIVTLVIAAGLGIPADSSSAYPNVVNNCNDDTITWHFADGGGAGETWSETKKAWARDAINTIDDELDHDGTRLVTLTESSSSGVAVKLREPENPREYGSSECDLGASMWINATHSGTRSFTYKVTRHEMLHLAGAEHGGRDDSGYSDNPATMCTCINKSEFRAENTLDQDAAAYMAWNWSAFQDRQLNANIGFERGLLYWFTDNGSVSKMSTGGATGPGQAVFYAAGSSSDSFIYQKVRDWTGSDAAVSVSASITAKSPLPGLVTRVEAAIYWKELFQGATANGCPYRSGIVNPNDETVSTDEWRKLAGSGLTTVGTDWTVVNSTTYSMSAVHDGHYFQVRAYGNTAGGHSVRFDNVHGRES